MSPSIPGGKVVREYAPPNLRRALAVTRLANASWHSEGNLGIRYMVDCNIHEAIDPGLTIWIVDVTSMERLTVAELLLRLPEDWRKPVLYS